jgi:N2,N2-dimethylguanosine tRNA methyltransferase
MEKVIKISPDLHDMIAMLAKANGKGIREMHDDLLRTNLGHLDNTVSRLTNGKSIEDVLGGIRQIEVDGHVYHCDECNHPLDPLAEPDKCPGCGAVLDWREQKSIGVMGWALAGLALLMGLGVIKNAR